MIRELVDTNRPWLESQDLEPGMILSEWRDAFGLTSDPSWQGEVFKIQGNTMIRASALVNGWREAVYTKPMSHVMYRPVQMDQSED